MPCETVSFKKNLLEEGCLCGYVCVYVFIALFTLLKSPFDGPSDEMEEADGLFDDMEFDHEYLNSTLSLGMYTRWLLFHTRIYDVIHLGDIFVDVAFIPPRYCWMISFSPTAFSVNT